MRERRVDLERLARLLDLLLLRQRLERAHVVEAVGELDQDDPDVGGHRDHHLAVVLGLVLVAALEGDPGELGDAVDERGDLVAELLAHLLEARPRCPRPCRGGAPRSGVSVSSRRPAQIFATSTGWMMKSSPDLRRWSAWRSQAKAKARSIVVAVDRLVAVGGVLADHREQVAEQRPLVGGQVLGDLVQTAPPGRAASSAPTWM